MGLIASGVAMVLLYDCLVEANTSNYRTVPWSDDGIDGSEILNQSLPPLAIDSSRLYFNRIPKAASTSMLNILHALSAKNNFTHKSSSVYNMRILTSEQQNELAASVVESEAPVTFDRHVHFVNFNSLGFDSPIFINMVRDPVERIISDYYYRRSVARKHIDSYAVTPSKFWLEKSLEECIRRSDDECQYMTGYLQVGHMVPYFCGHHQKCMVVNDEWALEQAKKNIERYYDVVGLVEMLAETIAVLEKRLPQFFSGASEILTRIGPHNVNLEKPSVDAAARNELKQNLTNDMILYNFIRDRLLRQIAELE
ncbi:uronyl 2-sulfotransferase [Galendromus occidentalis]|uniref:Uronyl 2-sulfotransferase n=1 Tax=Galendromus occidentalis TaxID=34638 RepID=A0AAJ7PB21_9ACAR|nr:uronyl 2-sulfotransferase [Galendromus occidentalis]